MANQFAIVTGASSGIGFSLAKELAERGYDLAICSAGERLHDAAESLDGLGVKVVEVQADLATREGVQQLWDQVLSLGRPIDVACINAGVGVGGLFTETDLDAELNMVYLNCAGTVQLAKYVVKHMTSRVTRYIRPAYSCSDFFATFELRLTPCGIHSRGIRGTKWIGSQEAIGSI